MYLYSKQKFFGRDIQKLESAEDTQTFFVCLHHCCKMVLDTFCNWACKSVTEFVRLKNLVNAIS